MAIPQILYDAVKKHVMQLVRESRQAGQEKQDAADAQGPNFKPRGPKPKSSEPSMTTNVKHDSIPRACQSRRRANRHGSATTRGNVSRSVIQFCGFLLTGLLLPVVFHHSHRCSAVGQVNGDDWQKYLEHVFGEQLCSEAASNGSGKIRG